MPIDILEMKGEGGDDGDEHLELMTDPQMKEVVKADLSLQNLNYSKLLVKILKKAHVFFAAAAVACLILAFPLHRTSVTQDYISSTTGLNVTFPFTPVRAAWAHLPLADAVAIDDALLDAYVELSEPGSQKWQNYFCTEPLLPFNVTSDAWRVYHSSAGFLQG